MLVLYDLLDIRSPLAWDGARSHLPAAWPSWIRRLKTFFMGHVSVASRYCEPPVLRTPTRLVFRPVTPWVESFRTYGRALSVAFVGRDYIHQRDQEAILMPLYDEQ